ncbi:Uncharacterised protein [Mycobacteroides abscessus subsp. abscessus]|nr:Uncharacterised protein [Mycobacteroides abscessus subsp. abscessus]
MNDPAAAICGCVRSGTPSMSLRNAIPCQCTVVGAGSPLATATRSTSPLRARIVGPGIWSP